MTIRAIRLINGDEIIGEVVGETDGYTIEKPAVFQITEGPGGQPQIAMGPYAPLSKDTKFKINESVIVFVYLPLEDLANNYNQNYGSGLITKTSQLIV